MTKKQRVWVKEEKRLVKLFYRKGLIKDFKIKDFYWASYRRIGNKYLLEVHYSTTDYWGECDEHPIVDYVKDVLYWINSDSSNLCEDGYPESSFKITSRVLLIRYLKNLKTANNNSAINKILKIREY